MGWISDARARVKSSLRFGLFAHNFSTEFDDANDRDFLLM